MKSLAAICLALALGIQSGHADTIDAFVEEAAQQSLFQNSSSRVALEKSALPEVREFAKQMIADHERFDKQIRQLGQSQNMAVPAEPSVASKAKQLRLESRDESFDRIYIDSQAETLEKADAVQERSHVFTKSAAQSVRRGRVAGHREAGKNCTRLAGKTQALRRRAEIRHPLSEPGTHQSCKRITPTSTAMIANNAMTCVEVSAIAASFERPTKRPRI